MEVKFDLTKDLQDLTRMVHVQLREQLRRTAHYQIDALLRPSGNFGQSSGVLFDILKQKIDAYVISPEFDAKVDKIITEMADNQIRDAICTLLASKTRKQFFLPSGPEAVRENDRG
jgi:hypothetical protein